MRCGWRKKYRSLVKSIDEWIRETDNTGRFVYSSTRVQDMLVYLPAEIIGLRLFDLMLPESGKMYYRMMAMAQRDESFTALTELNIIKNSLL
jgi:PAS domain S-box-containing protein